MGISRFKVFNLWRGFGSSIFQGIKMANRNFSEVQGLARKQIVLAGHVNIAANASVASQSFIGGTITKTGTGAYTLTLDDKYQALLSASAQVAETSADLFGKIGAVDVVSAKTIVIQTVDATGAAVDASATLKVYITLVLSNSSVN
jgi:hypothetical protein